MSIDLFRTRDHVPDFDAKVLKFKRHSAATRRKLKGTVDVRYGSHPAQTLDLFVPASSSSNPSSGLPVHIFIHGGYWRMFSKSDFSFVARTIVDAGAIAVIIDYGLMPTVRMAEIVRQVREAKSWVTDNIHRYGGDPDRLTVSGHSAGAHLATFLFTGDEVGPPRGALLLGGVYNLSPLRGSFLQPMINLTEEEVSQFSPLDRRFHPRVDTVILYGELETRPFRAQAASLAWQLKGAGCDVALSYLPQADHMSSVLDLGFPVRRAGAHLASLIRKH